MMKIKSRNGEAVSGDKGQDRLLQALYGNIAGRALLKALSAPGVSRIAGCFLSSGLSRGLIASFVRKHRIDLSQFEAAEYKSYNEFFSRRIRPELRPIDRERDHLIAPCDSKLTALPILEGSRFTLKNTPYTVAEMLKNEALAKKYQGGTALIFRLTVDDYHRYCYISDGEKSENVFIPGRLQTVNPIANDYTPIYKENAREYCLLHSADFGDMVVMEVGALLVGKIVNHHGASRVHRGEEKGYFQFGGSTVVVLLEKDSAHVDEDIWRNSQEGAETIVRMGEKIGEWAQRDAV